ncbi:hypothetical protein [Burkholderia sp. Bp8984]|uniref:hypothetical protein n=1 Tax=Burkholderia sp. Bp8984 TaxID=2184549 RepID=UPI00162513DA|nr:hypothetical protein [Burkholderia sp. Bp8984]
MGEKPGLLISAAIHSRSTVAAQQLIAGVDALAFELFRASCSSRWSQYFLSFASLRPIIFRDRVTAEFLLQTRRAGVARTRRRCHVIASSPDFFGQEIPVQKSDLTTVIVRRGFARFSHDEASFYVGFCRV